MNGNSTVFTCALKQTDRFDFGLYSFDAIRTTSFNCSDLKDLESIPTHSSNTQKLPTISPMQESFSLLWFVEIEKLHPFPTVPTV